MGAGRQRAPGAPLRALLAACFAFCSWLPLAACWQAEHSSERDLQALERLCFVAAGTARLQGSVEIGLEEALLVGRFEVTRSEWEEVFKAPPDAGGFVSDAAQSFPERGRWPAFASYLEAERYVAAIGMRLPSLEEWLYLAGGSRGSVYPWGRPSRLGLANTSELALGHPTAVGTFEGGRSPSGCYDMVGNVAEWVHKPAASRPVIGDPLQTAGDAWVLGGSYLSSLQPLHQQDPSRGSGLRLAMLVLDESQRSPDVGFRVVAPARIWLLEHASGLAAAPNARPRLTRLGRDFGPLAVGLLEALYSEHPEAQALAWLLEGARP